MRTLVIAEIGSCHDGKLPQALDLVRLAADVGADAVKAQWWSSPERLAERRHAPEYLDVYRRYAIPFEWLGDLRAEADLRGVEFMCTCYLPEDLSPVAPLVSRLKIASFEACDLDFVLAHHEYNKPIIASTGMMSLEEIEVLIGAVVGQQDSALLHCASAYPCPPEQVNLAAIGKIRGLMDSFELHTAVPPILVGFSDHTCHVGVGALAVAAGARVVEFHLRHQETEATNPDYAVSLDPSHAGGYVDGIRFAESALGAGFQRPEAEAAMRAYRVGRP